MLSGSRAHALNTLDVTPKDLSCSCWHTGLKGFKQTYTCKVLSAVPEVLHVPIVSAFINYYTFLPYSLFLEFLSSLARWPHQNPIYYIYPVY